MFVNSQFQQKKSFHRRLAQPIAVYGRLSLVLVRQLWMMPITTRSKFGAQSICDFC
jgi:hypothetical protein